MPVKEIQRLQVPKRRKGHPKPSKFGFPRALSGDITDLLNNYDLKAKPLAVSEITVDIFNHEKIAFSRLAEDSEVTEMTRKELLCELKLYVEVSDRRNLMNGPFIYGLHVLEPIDIGSKVDPAKFGINFPDTILPLLKSGNISHDILYKLSEVELNSFLGEIISHAGVIDISIKPTSAGYTEHRIVKLSDSL